MSRFGDSKNLLLSSLSPADRDLLGPLEPLSLAIHDNLEVPAKRIDWVYFPELGIASVVAVGGGGVRVEVGLIGREGVSGAPVILGTESSPHETYIQVAGDASRVPAIILKDAMAQSPTLAAIFFSFVQVFMVQTAHTAIANARGKLEERLARWLLMAHDRIGGDELPLTHQFLALMLGVRRAGVTESVQKLEGKRMIRARRGIITILDRQALKAQAGPYYGVPEAEYRRLLPGKWYANVPA